jgi:hypothetical protein
MPYEKKTKENDLRIEIHSFYNSIKKKLKLRIDDRYLLNYKINGLWNKHKLLHIIL